MIVRTETPDLKATRQAVLSLIMSYHSDRCLTCHRVVKCKPGDTCLRDDVVTHRCLTCSKNYRCELQTTCEMLEMAGYEPWDGDDAHVLQPRSRPPDQGTRSSSLTRRCASSAPAASAPAMSSATPARSRWPAAVTARASSSGRAARSTTPTATFAAPASTSAPRRR